MGTDTTGNYVATVTAGTGLTSTGATSGESIAHSLSVDAAQTQITSVGTLTALTGGTGDLNWDSNTLVVDSSESKVGIGTAAPLEALHIEGTSPSVKVKATNAGGQAEIKLVSDNGSQDADNKAIVSDNNGLHLKNLVSGSWATNMSVDNSGNVGIGTAAPTSKITIQSNNSSHNANHESINFANSNSSTLGKITAHQGTNQYYGSLIFSTPAWNTGTVTERMRIDSVGRVGIGTVTPDLKLDVTETASSTWTAVMQHTHSGTNANGLKLITAANDGTTQLLLAYSAALNPILTVRANGLVGIGTVPTDTLHVNGRVRVKKSYAVNGLLRASTSNVVVNSDIDQSFTGGIFHVTMCGWQDDYWDGIIHYRNSGGGDGISGVYAVAHNSGGVGITVSVESTSTTTPTIGIAWTSTHNNDHKWHAWAWN